MGFLSKYINNISLKNTDAFKADILSLGISNMKLADVEHKYQNIHPHYGPKESFERTLSQFISADDFDSLAIYLYHLYDLQMYTRYGSIQLSDMECKAIIKRFIVSFDNLQVATGNNVKMISIKQRRPDGMNELNIYESGSISNNSEFKINLSTDIEFLLRVFNTSLIPLLTDLDYLDGVDQDEITIVYSNNDKIHGFINQINNFGINNLYFLLRDLCRNDEVVKLFSVVEDGQSPFEAALLEKERIYDKIMEIDLPNDKIIYYIDCLEKAYQKVLDKINQGTYTRNSLREMTSILFNIK